MFFIRRTQSGPLRVVVYLKGRLQDVYEWQTRLFLHADEPAVRAEHTIGGLGDREVDLVKRIRVTLDTSLGERYAFRVSGGAVEFDGRVEPGEAVVLRQEAPSLLPQTRDFAYELSVSGPDGGRTIGRGGRSDGWLRCFDDRLSVGVAVRRFSEKSPKGLRFASGGGCGIDLWPAGQPLRLSRARAITHEVLYAFQATPDEPHFDKHYQRYHHKIQQDLPYRAYVRPIVPVVDPEYMCGTRAFGPSVSAASSRLRDYEKVMQQSFENFLGRWQDRATSYGMMHYGDYITPWPGDNGGNPDRPHWRDQEWEFLSAVFTRYLRTGDPRAFHLGLAGLQHFMDVDVHYTRHFSFYHSYGDDGEMHEEYHGPEIGHVVTAGLVDAYLFTGDRRALEAARRMCDRHVAVFSEGPEKIRAMLGRQMRSIPWPMLSLMRFYEITGEDKYIKAAGNAFEVLVQSPDLWQRNGGTWGVGLLGKAIEDYHRLTGDIKARELFLSSVDWAIDSYYIPQKRTFGQRPGKPTFGYGPERVEGGPALMVIAATFGYAYELTGDTYYLEVAYHLLHEGMRSAPELLPRDDAPADRRGYQAGAARSDGKWFAMINFYTNRLPASFSGLSAEAFERIARTAPRHRGDADPR